MAVETKDRSKLDAILERNQRRPELLIQVLQDVQAEFGYLPEGLLRCAAERLGVPVTRIFHVATFYKAFSLQPRGKHVITVCRGTACHVRRSERLVDAVERELGIGDGETSENLLFTLECVNCLGACALAPVVVIDGVYYEKVTPDRLRTLIEECRNGGPKPAEEEPKGPSKRKVRRLDRKQKRKEKKAKGKKAASGAKKKTIQAQEKTGKARKRKNNT